MTAMKRSLCLVVLLASCIADKPSVAPALRRPAPRKSTKLLAAQASGGQLPTASTKEVKGKGKAVAAPVSGSWKWAILHNYLYFLALGLSIPVLPRLISTIVNPDGSSDVTSASSVLGGDVEALDKLCTFLGVGFLGACSDVVGRKPLIAYSALGFAVTCLMQAQAKSSLWPLYVADVIDGVSSCMNTVCQAYVTDASPPERRAVNLGIFQGLSVAGAFILGFPLSAVISAKYGLRGPMYAAAGVGFLNAAIALFITPESLPKPQRQKQLDLAAANPIGALRRLFTGTPLLRGSAAAFALLWLANTCMNSQFGNYVNHLFGWGPQESAPLLVLIGIMFLIAPGLLVPRLGLKRSIESGALIYGVGLLCTAFARTPPQLVWSVLLTSVGCIGTVSLVAFIANQADPAERGALLGAVETLQELMEALGHSGYGRLFAFAISDASALKLPGSPFLVASGLLLAALATIKSTFAKFPAAAASFLT